MQSGEETALLPVGSDSELPSPPAFRLKVSFPATTPAPPSRDQPDPPASNPPLGARTYSCPSPHGLKTCLAPVYEQACAEAAKTATTMKAAARTADSLRIEFTGRS